VVVAAAASAADDATSRLRPSFLHECVRKRAFFYFRHSFSLPPEQPCPLLRVPAASIPSDASNSSEFADSVS
jgi:hypothetical protein